MKRYPARQTCLNAICLVLSAALCDHASGGEFIPVEATGRMGMASCHKVDTSASLGLTEVVELALCQHPQTRQAWAQVKAQGAAVEIQKAGYLPVVNGTLGVGKASGDVDNDDSTGASPLVRHGGINLNWTLLDTGLRSANLAQARQLMAAAAALQDLTLQRVFLNAAQAYYEALTTQGAYEAALESEHAAEESLSMTEAKYKAGVGTLAEQLQAQTQHAEAVLSRVRLDNTAREAQGALALAMGMEANTPLQLRAADTTTPRDNTFLDSVDELITQARRTHPALVAAEAQQQAAQARVDAVNAEGRPTVVLTGGVNRQSTNAALLNDNMPTGKRIGIQVNIPLFEGMARGHRVQLAQAQLESKSAELADAAKQIGFDVWKHYHAVRSATESMSASEHLRRSAEQAYKVARGRYKVGVGTVVDMLNAQGVLASVRQQHVQSAAAWRLARLKLAASLGKLGFSSLLDDITPAAKQDFPKPVTAESKGFPLRAPSRREGVLEALQAWALAWSTRDVDTYLDAYADDFQPPRGLSRQEWEDERRLRIIGKRRIAVTISDPQIMLTGDTARIRFRQQYQSDRLQEESMKTIVMIRRDGRWLMREEN